MDLARQEMFLGGIAKSISKGLKKVTRAVKKVAKSPIGKAALLYFGGKALMPGGLSGLQGTLFGVPGVPDAVGKEGLFTKLGLTKGGGSLMPTLLGGGILGLGALSLFGNKEEEEDLDMGPELTMEQLRAIRNSPYRYTAPRFEGSQYKFADGGRIGLKDGNGIADEEAENARFAKRVRELMDEGFDMGEAVREAMKEGYADGGRIGFFKGAQADTKKGKSMSPGTDTKGNVRDDNPFTGGGGDTPTDDDKTFIEPPKVDIKNIRKNPYSNLNTPMGVAALSPAILARIARMGKKIRPIFGGDVGLEYADEAQDATTNFKIIQDIGDLIKEKKLNPELKYKKEIGDNTLIEGGLDAGGDFNIFLKKKFADGGRIGLKGGTGSKILNFLKPFGGETKGGKQLEGLLYGSEGLGEILRLLSSSGMFAEGGDVEPVAKKTMPLLDMDGKEMDLRAEGGFVPIGRMEKADDVPARLSKNEFVFTADAVRNAGDGDVDKGAEVMYNMMKNLESGGDVSEESQGLEGARDMFQTSKRLEEVI